MRLSLLPKDVDRGWLPYLWLVYLVLFWMHPILTSGHRNWVATTLATLAFLVLYFWGYWLRGIRKLYAIAGLVALGCILASSNTGASIFFIYAAGYVGELGSLALAYRMLAGLVGVIGIASYFLQPHPGFWIPASAFTVMVGLVDIHFAQRRFANARLRLAHDEIERLAKIAERERIARDLHDLLGHTLSVIVLKSELASKLAEKDTARAVSEIREVERISRDALAEVRAAVKGYSSVSLSAEARNAADVLKTAGVQVETSIEPVPLAAAQEGVLAMALREAATNVVRHAGATACSVKLRRSGSACELEVQDNGAGGNAREGCGLSGMRQRIEALGGTMERDGSQGTRLSIRLPLSQP
ncbi:MAG TPA: sensor histidine kinase [Bryobacteraceae bacterium]|nr:sensor histidine kinase [Bryobacteraceae bacterium]